jgi:hypothetical protein
MKWKVEAYSSFLTSTLTASINLSPSSLKRDYDQICCDGKRYVLDTRPQRQKVSFLSSLPPANFMTCRNGRKMVRSKFNQLRQPTPAGAPSTTLTHSDDQSVDHARSTPSFRSPVDFFLSTTPPASIYP